jgi:large subunit ribosomal protein L30
MVEEKTQQKRIVENQSKILAVVRVRGNIGVTAKISDTLKLIRLHKKHRCVIVPANKNYIGMVNKIKDYSTYGELDEQTFVELLENRGKTAGDKQLTNDFLKNSKLDIKTFAKKYFAGEIRFKDVAGLKPFFKLHPPKGGFERAGIKKPYSMHGALGYRGTEINKLIRKMI